MLDFDKILLRLPSLQNLLDTYGSMSLFEYAKEHYHSTPNTSPLFISRKEEFLNFLEGYVTRKFGAKYAETVVDTLSRNYAVSTAEHHGPMGHPFFFQSALLRAITQPELPVVNFATSHVSLGNSSYPRGLVFHTDRVQNKEQAKAKEQAKEGIFVSCPLDKGGQGGLHFEWAEQGEGHGGCSSGGTPPTTSFGGGVGIVSDNQLNQLNKPNEINGSYLHLPFFSSKLRMCPVFALPAYTREDITEHCIKRLKKYYREHIVSEKMYENILAFIQEHVLSPGILALKMYSEQITHLNHIWWNSLFPDLPPYISLDAEDIVAGLLQEHLHKDTIMMQLLTDITLQPHVEEYFNGISCCFDLSNHSGTYLFWYLDEHHRRHALWREGDELVSQDKSFRMKMTSEVYLYHLEQRHLAPSGLLVYTMFACYYGVTCFGGIFQGDYLPQVKKAFENIFSSSIGMGDIQTGIINADLYYMLREDGEPITALDFIINPLQSSFLEQAKILTLDQSIKNCCRDL